MEFFRKNWYYIGGILFVVLAFVIGIYGGDIDSLRKILILSFMAFLVHQFEEYACPGGFPGIFNIAVLGEKKVPERYPLNANQVMISNVFLTYPFYILPVFFPHLIWLGLIQVGQGMIQIINHGIVNNRALKSLYNPGLAAVVFLNWPIGVYYIWYVTTNNLASTADFVIGAIGTILSLFVLWLGPIRIFRNKASKYPFTEAQMYGYGKEKVEKIRNS